MGLLSFIREKYHPLFYIRRFTAIQKLTRLLDVPLAIRFPSISHPVYVSLSKNLSFVLSRGKIGEERERQNFIKLVKRGEFRRFFDIGANIGLYGFIFQTTVVDGIVTMFEPDEDNAQLILRTIARAEVLGVELVQAAVSDNEGMAMFYKDDLSGSTGSVLRGGFNDDAFVSVHYRYKPREVSVRSVTLDGLASRRGDPDLIKIDVEGAELGVLYGANALIERSHPALFFECDENQGIVYSFLAERGYVFFDFSTMRVIEELTHNNLALHVDKHAALLRMIDKQNYF